MYYSWRYVAGCIGLLLPATAWAQFPPAPEGITILKSKFDQDITISYKEPGLCETTPGVRSYAGYVHLPPGTLDDFGQEQNYSINTFFWFFEARKDPENAPLSIWINGGPGASSMFGLLAENGPCYVNSDSNSTRLNPNSWNNEGKMHVDTARPKMNPADARRPTLVNMLYLDQPVQVGFSYDSLKNYTVNLITDDRKELKAGEPIPEQNATFLVGTGYSTDGNLTTRGTRNSAVALWHFAQVWFQEFPGYHPNDSRISLASQSYGGRFGPGFTSFFEEQNEKILNGTWDVEGEQYIIHLDTLLLISSCMDRRVEWPLYPEMAFNNTYGIQTVNESIYNDMKDAYTRSGGCRDQIDDCRAVASVYDPANIGINETVNKICSDAEEYCGNNIRGPYSQFSGRKYYDITQIDPTPFPYQFLMGWLNQPHVQSALGVPLNFTMLSPTVNVAFRSMGDYPRPGWLEYLSYLLDRGIKVTLITGDRDFACNWLAGEATSLAIDHAGAEGFRAAGYEPIQAGAARASGLVRQHGNLSFSRVFQAGHEVPSYQPEAALAIFSRALGNLDIATGTRGTAGPGGYSSAGPADALATGSEVPEQALMFCYVLVPYSCLEEKVAAVENGSARIVSYIVEDANSTQLFPELFGGPR